MVKFHKKVLTSEQKKEAHLTSDMVLDYAFSKLHKKTDSNNETKVGLENFEEKFIMKDIFS